MPRPTPPTTLERQLSRALLLRTLSLSAALTALLFALQLLRLLDSVSLALLPPALLARIALGVLPALLTLTLPLAFLASVMLAYAEAARDGELLGLRALGIPPHQLLHRPTLLATALTALSVLALSLLSPWALTSARTHLLNHAATTLIAQAQPDAQVELGTWAGSSPVTLHDVRLVTRPGAISMDQLHITSKHHQLTLLGQGAHAHIDAWSLSAGAVELSLPGSRAAHTLLTSLPELETRSLIPLLDQQAHDPRAAGQLVKRSLLALLPMLAPLLLALMLPSPRMESPSFALALSLAVGLTAVILARAGEVLARESRWTGYALVLAVALGLWQALRWSRRRLETLW